jgi:hypothetical protein
VPQFEARHYDAALARAIDDLPGWALATIDEGIVRVEQRVRPDGLLPEPGLRLIVYREPSIDRARDREQLERFARADLVRAIVWQLDLPLAAERLRSFAAAVPVVGTMPAA